MISLAENQKKTIASGLTVLSFTVVFAFVACVAWLVLKALSFTAPIVRSEERRVGKEC